MNTKLTQQIVHHIFSGLGVAPNSLVKNSKFESIKSKKYLLSEKLIFSDENGQEIKNNIWGTQLFVENNNLKILVGDCTTTSDVLEFAAVIHLEENPTYGIYLNYGDDESYPLISVSLDGINWMNCNTYLQATFLAAMENIKNIPFNWRSIDQYKKEHDSLLSYIKYYDKFYEDQLDEGQES
jgi:hypothetical protein